MVTNDHDALKAKCICPTDVSLTERDERPTDGHVTPGVLISKIKKAWQMVIPDRIFTEKMKSHPALVRNPRWRENVVRISSH